MFSPIEEALEDIKNGEMVVVVDDEDRENEGDLVMAAEKVTAEDINFMAKYGRGLICLPLTDEKADQLDLPLMVTRPEDSMKTAFTVSIDAKETSTGISAHERAQTIQVAVSDDAQPQDLVRPGHIFPLRAKEGGVLRRPGHTEAAVDLARLAGLKPAGVICEIMNDDGTMARLPQLENFICKHDLKLISISDLIKYRLKKETLVESASEVDFPTKHGHFRLIPFTNILSGKTHVALVKGEWKREEAVLVRVHSECFTGDVFGSKRCDCGDQLKEALEKIEEEGCGVFLYMRQEGRGIGLYNKLQAYALQDEGMDTVEANQALGFPPDARDYGIGAQILMELGVGKMRLLTNNPQKYNALAGYGLEIVERVPLEVKPNDFNREYLRTKKTKLGHLLESC